MVDEQTDLQGFRQLFLHDQTEGVVGGHLNGAGRAVVVGGPAIGEHQNLPPRTATRWFNIATAYNETIWLKVTTLSQQKAAENIRKNMLGTANMSCQHFYVWQIVLVAW